MSFQQLPPIGFEPPKETPVSTTPTPLSIDTARVLPPAAMKRVHRRSNQIHNIVIGLLVVSIMATSGSAAYIFYEQNLNNDGSSSTQEASASRFEESQVEIIEEQIRESGQSTSIQGNQGNSISPTPTENQPNPQTVPNVENQIEADENQTETTRQGGSSPAQQRRTNLLQTQDTIPNDTGKTTITLDISE